MIVSPVRDLIIAHHVDAENDSNKNVPAKQFSELLRGIVNTTLTKS